MNTTISSLIRSTPRLLAVHRCGNARRPHTIHLANWQQIRLRSSSESLPKIASPSIWSSVVPKFLRSRGSSDPSGRSLATKEWNPASFFIIIFVLIGSQAIQLLMVRKDYENFTRKAEAKLALLKEVIQRLKDGEQVDVERLLGTGDEAKEREWEEVLREIEREDSLWRQKSSKTKGADQQESPEKADESNPAPQTSAPSSQADILRVKDNSKMMNRFY